MQPMQGKTLGLSLGLLIATLSAPSADAKSDGGLLVSSLGTHNILRYSLEDGSFVEEFVPESAGVGNATGLLYGWDANLYVGNTNGNYVLRCDGQSGDLIDIFTEMGYLDMPEKMLSDPVGNLLVTSCTNSGCFRFERDSGYFLDTFPDNSRLDCPFALAYGPDGNIYITSDPNEVHRYDAQTGAFIDVFVASGDGGLWSGADLTFGPDGHLYVLSAWNSSVLRYDGQTGDFLDTFVPSGSGGLSLPVGLSFGPDGNLYVTSLMTSQVLLYDGETGDCFGAFVDAGSGGLDGPADLIFMPGSWTPGDVDHDGDVDQQDLGRLLAAYEYCDGETGYARDCDINGDGVVNQPDLGILLANYNTYKRTAPPLPPAEKQVSPRFNVPADANLYDLRLFLRSY
jgi:WD40 repeat protein